MSTKIILFKTHKINLTNLAISQIVENSPESFYDSCRYTLVHGKSSISQPNNSLKNIGEVRDRDWSTGFDYLDKCLESGKKLIFGSHHDSQINLLKQKYGMDVLTVGINYDEDLYQSLLKNVAEYHVYLLRTGSIDASEKDDILIETLVYGDLVKYYMREFDSINLVPRSSFINCDYNIPVADFFDKQKMSNHFDKIGFPFTKESQSYYDQWLASNSLDFSS